MTTPSRHTIEFWNGLRDGDLRIQSCSACTKRYFPPNPTCPACGSSAVSWTTISPTGTIYSFTQVHRAAPGFDTPRVLGQLTLDAGPRIFGVIDATYETLSIGDPARIEPFDYTDAYDRGALEDYPYYHIVPTEP